MSQTVLRSLLSLQRKASRNSQMPLTLRVKRLTLKRMKKNKKNLAEIALRKELADIVQKEKELQSRKREIKMQLSMMYEKPAAWDDSTPMIKLVYSCHLKKFKELITAWQKVSEVPIDIKKAYRFDFKPDSKAYVIRNLKNILAHGTKVFNINERQLFLYLESHSNLGTFDCIKKAYQRCKL